MVDQGRKKGVIDPRRIEEISLRTWPALSEVLYDGWRLRFSDGYTKRANSVNPLEGSKLDVETKIDVCEAYYRSRGVPTTFRLTPFATPAGLDDVLAARGYRRSAPTLVQALDLGTWRDPGLSAQLTPADATAWLAAYEACAGESLPDAHRAILDTIIYPCHLAVLEVDGRPMSCGMVVLSGDYAGIYSVITAAASRRRGFGRRLMEGLLGWAQSEGATWAYLQVQEDNLPGRALYERLGFETLYRYWYRLRPA
jgi:ribosomal protein S18 acetylase RimI-like enzyme